MSSGKHTLHTYKIADQSVLNGIFIALTDCESLIRNMLVLDPSRRYSIEQIKHHRWMLIEGSNAIGLNCDISNKSAQEPNEQILRLMVGLGIDAQKTRESLKV